MKRKDSQAGFTMLEAIIVLTIVTALTAMITESLTTLSSNQKWSERQSSALSKAELVMAAITEDLEAAIRVFPECATSRDLIARLDLGSLAPRSSDVLALPTSRGHFEPDPAGRLETGNLLLLARAEEPIVVPTSIGARTARIDRFRFVVYAMHEHDGRLDIDRWESVAVARADDVARLIDPDERAGTVMALNRAGITIAWRPDEPDFNYSLFALTQNGNAPHLDPNAKIGVGATPPRREMLARANLQVARNGGGGSIAMPLFAHQLADYPHGFEIKFDGDGSGRLVFARLVVSSPVKPGERLVAAVVERVIAVREP